MEKKSKLFVIIAICAVIAVMLASVFLIRGCGNPNDESGDDVSLNIGVSETVSETETSESDVLNNSTVKKLLEDTISGETFVGENLPLSFQFSNAVVTFTTYEILNLTDQNTAIVEFEYVDVLKMADDYSGSDENQDEFYLYCIEKIENKTAPTITNEVEVILAFDESDGTYNIVNSVELADALTGGIASEYLEILNGRG